VANAGIKQIEGDLVGDESYFHGAPYGTDWAVDDLQYYYGALASALTVQDNVIDLIFKPGKKIGEPLEIAVKPPTTFVALSNRTQTASTNAKANIDIYRPLGENVAYIWGRLAINSKT